MLTDLVAHKSVDFEVTRPASETRDVKVIVEQVFKDMAGALDPGYVHKINVDFKGVVYVVFNAHKK